ncbi:DMT family transporter [Chitinibacteraceae bacterium HSL-7]
MFALNRSDLMLLAVALVWGCSYGVSKVALAFYPVLGLIALRFALTALLLLPVMIRRVDRITVARALPTGTLLFAIFVCEISGVARTGAANAAFLISLTIVFTPWLEWLVSRRTPDPHAIRMALMAALGALLMSGGLRLEIGIGDALMLAAAILRATLVVLTARYTAHSPIDPLSLTGWQSLWVALLAGGAMLVSGPLPDLPATPVFWSAVLFLVLGCTLFAFFAQNLALKTTRDPSRVALLMGSEPIFGAAFAVLILGEHLTMAAGLGALLILGATLWPRPLRAEPSA